MKRFILLCILLSSAYLTSAQTKGDIAIGGDLGLSTTQMINTSEVGDYYMNQTQHYGTTFTIKPKFCYFAANNFEMDLSIGYTLSGGYLGDGDYMHYIAGSFGMHYYVSIINNRFYYTPGFSLDFGGIKNVEIRSDGQRISDTGMPFVFGANIELGRFEFKLNKHWGFSASMLTLTVSTSTGLTKFDRSTSIGVNLNCGLTLGTLYYF